MSANMFLDGGFKPEGPNVRCVIISSQSTFLFANDVRSWLATDVGRTGYEGSSHGSLLPRDGQALIGIYINNTYY